MPFSALKLISRTVALFIENISPSNLGFLGGFMEV
jgi:hypothetical protein